MHSNRQNVSKQQQQQHQNHCTCGGGSRRWAPIASVAIFLCLIASGVSKTQAVSLALPTDDGTGDGGVIAASAQLLHRALRDVAAFAANFVPDDARDATVNGGTMDEASSSSSSPSASAGSSSSSSSSSSSTQPQGQCLLDGILVAETTVFCEKQVGCRAIQKTGHCCPDYKCDCEKDGKTYSNGDKLVDPETPCTVCYCQGGEILCSSVTCYHRDDCTPKFISGRCCPEYDNCPVSSPEPTTTTNKTLIDSMAAFASSTVKPEVPAAALNPKITIKEITKPIEIRITDENKAIPIHQMLKPSTTTTTTTTTTSTTTTTTEAATASTATTTTIANSAAAATTTTLSQTQTSSEDGSSAKASSSTNESFSGDANQQQHNNNNNKHNGNNNNNNRPTGGINNESLKLSASVAYASTEHPTMMGSAGTGNGNGIPFTTRAQEVHEIVMVDNRNGGEKPFAAFGTQGLQRVESEGANDPSKVNIKREFLDTTEGVAPGHASSSSSSSSSSSHSNSNFNSNSPVTSSSSSDEFGSSELIYGQPGAGPTTSSSSTGQGQGHVGNLLHSSGELAEPETAGSDNIYHIILTTDGPRVGGSTENYLALKGSQTEGLNAFESSFNLGHEDSQPSSSESSFAASTERLDSSTEGLDTSSSYDSSTQEPSASSTETIHHHSHNHNHQHHLTEDEDIAIPMESNPAYPSLPEDDFSLRDVNFPLNENDDDLKDEPRSIGGGSFDALKSTKHLDDLDTFRHLGSGSGSGDLESSTWQSSSTESSGDMMNSTPKVALMYSMEDGSSSSSQETAVSNATDFHSIVGSRLKESENETDSDESLEIDSVELIADGGSGSGAGSGDFGEKKAKQREHTTPRPARGAAEGLDIDELGSAEGPKSPLEDPKLDVESLKLDESHDDGLAKPDAVTKANILAVKTNAAQDRTVEPLMGSGIVQRLFLQRVY